ncbi:4-aminobutyrate--2-oxoglutarate transaminase [Bacillus sp. FJAT-42376]|uniref:4-aminobutyrate--2-oxoglutarate transaminase n=1 Tax=Bacillus sp. FJAT-42376 TaxID=2014076 RepID=UPI001F15688E|nr:4-aminobutyrate--2-oxoglutarate transaminase [Bacillus sp. FJAT-42376]
MKRRNEHVPRGPFHVVNKFITKAKGARVTDVEGNTYLDFAGGIGTLNAGHCPDGVVKALKEQLELFIHPSFHVLLYESYIDLAEELNRLTPGDHHKKTFFLNSGAEAVENAVKIARRATGRRAVVSFERGFHGRTYMAMGLTSKVKPYKNGFGPFPPDVYKLPFPYYFHSEKETPEEIDAQAVKQLETFFLTEVPPEEIAAFIMEPVQGEGGFVIPSANFVQKVKNICEKNGILFIADEVQTGFGRTGKWFGIEHFGVVPDLITMSKSIAAGLPISAVTGRAELMDAPEIGEIGGTYGGSPLGCKAALEVIKMIETQGLLDRSEKIGETIESYYRKWTEELPFIGEGRRLGAMAAIEITEQGSKKPDKLQTASLLKKIHDRGVIVMSAGLYGNVIRFLCPLVISDEELIEGLDVIDRVLYDS